MNRLTKYNLNVTTTYQAINTIYHTPYQSCQTLKIIDRDNILLQTKKSFLHGKNLENNPTVGIGGGPQILFSK